MNIEELREFCLSLRASEESFPFDDEILVFSVKGKMFCLVNIVKYEFINLKCDPEEAIELREQYPEVTAGWHMNKKHWNSVYINGKISHNLLKKWIVNSYNLVVKGLPEKIQEELL
ncbi:MmcQ/YjbR family DNA-binding protein [Capnocytophaga cynodegmi]|uniref:MmcQ/YjbR family DNA-binding protein n=1 Tax=Capnocytophaga cynodegmi TaxID=28189 RepID=UPI0037D657D9